MTAMPTLVALLATSTLTRARLAALGSLGLLAVIVGVAVGRSDTVSALRAGTDLVNGYGLTVLAPVVTLVLASAALGDTVDDGTLVYLWLRPVGRATVAASAYLASIVVAVPVVVVPLTVAAALTGGGGALVAGAVASATLAVVGYAGIFVALGLVARRALAWGIVYILIWEGFIARAGTASSQWSIQYYARSVLSEVADVSLRLGDASLGAAIVMPLVFAVLGVAVTAARLHRMSVV
jgi:ABC-2 type transport system permease protein